MSPAQVSGELQNINYVIDFFMALGVMSAAISGALRAIKVKMDISGAMLLAFVTADGGGTIRDVILQTSIFWVAQQFYLWIALIIGAATFIIVYIRKRMIGSKQLFRLFLLTDALGLAAFSLAGTEKALAFHQNGVIAVVMGICTAFGGGIMADVISNQVPLVLSQGLYITVAFIGSTIYLILINFMPSILAGLIATAIMFVLRMYSIKLKWRHPTI